MLERMPIKTWIEWQMYTAKYAWGDDVIDMQMARLQSIICGMFGGKGNGTDPAKFLLRKAQTRPRQQTPNEMMAVLRLHAEAHNSSQKVKASQKQQPL